MTLERRWRWFALWTAVTLAADQLTKEWALSKLTLDRYGRGIPDVVIENFWDWRLSFNQGSAFGLFHGVNGARIFLSVVAFVMLGVMVWMLHKAKNHQTRLIVALGLVSGGAIGNLIDRVLVGKVTDFIVWKYYKHEWPTFNIADAALCVGIGLMLLEGQKNPEPKPEKGKPKTKPT